MYTDKLQNPFLKPSPFSNSLNSGSSYLNSDPPPRYQSYKPYKEPKLSYQDANSSYNKYDKPSYYEQNRASHSPRPFQSNDIDSILSKNPFNRSYQPLFAQQRPSRDISPGRASNNMLQPRSSNEAFEDFNANPYGYEYSRISSNTSARASQIPSRYTPARNNYLSTSSADSATTYIDKIYDLGDDRGQHERHQSKPLTNPFNRKSLLGNNYQSQTAKNMDYDMGYLKYASLAYQEDKRPPSLNLDRYEEDYNNKYPPAVSTYQNNYPITSSTYQNQPRPSASNLQRGLTFGEQNPGTSKDKYQSAPYQDNYTSSYNADVPYKNVYDSYKHTYENPPPPPIEYEKYDRYDKDYEQPRFGTNNSIKYNNYEYESNKYDRPEQFGNLKESEKFNFDDPGNDYGGPAEQRRVRFSEKSEESNYQDYGKFQTLGGKPYEIQKQYRHAPREPDPDSFARYPSSLNKLSSSQVDQYTSPEEMEKKIKQSKYNQLGYENPPRSSAKFFQDPPLRAPTRDSAQEHPRVLEFNGILFHKIEVM